MSGIITDLSQSPFWDDYNASKQYYRILFIPKRAVQVREMNQMQTMIQEQITRFGNHVFKDGSIVNGCNITHIPDLDFVRCSTFQDTSGSNTQFTTAALADCLVVSNQTGLRAAVHLAFPGYLGTYPDTNVLYVNYLNKGRDTGNNEVNTFTASETLSIYSSSQDKFGNLNPGFLYNTVNVFTPNLAANQTAIGTGYGIRVGDGVVYQKGYFVNVLPHTILVRKYDTNTDNMLVGFQTAENIVTYLNDSSLIDPADTSNRSGIGANRLKLTPELFAVNKASITENDEFFPIIEFGENNTPVKQDTDPAYAALGDSMAKRSFETNGDYYIKPFITSTAATANTQNFKYTIDPGVGYVKGNRVQLVGAISLEKTRAIDVGFNNANIITLNYGSYVVINQFSGMFNSDKLVTVNIYNAPQTAVASNRVLNSPTGTLIGTANVRAVAYNNGIKGTGSETYRLYITNINMTAGNSFVNNAKSFQVSSTVNGTQGAMADIVLENNKAVIKDSGSSSLIFDTGVVGTKRLRDSMGSNDTQFIFKDTSTATVQANGSVTFTLNTPYAGGAERFFVSSGVLSDINKLQIDVTNTGTILSANLAGTVNANTGNTTVLGTGTSFTTNFTVGQYINLNGVGLRRITAIANTTSLTVNAAVSGGSATATYNKAFIAGTTFDLTNSTVTAVSNTQFIVNLGFSISSGAPQTLVATYPVIRTGAYEAKKEKKAGTYVKIDCATNVNTTKGPYNLGIVDAYSIANVWVGNTYSESNPDRAGWFTLDSGQNLTHYDHAKLILKPEFSDKLTSGSKILVKLNHFAANNATGIGFFSVDSYPVRAPGVAANTTNISYEDIPEYSGYNLRNAIDFRPQKFNTATIATTAASATVNPANSNTSFNVSASGAYIGDPDSTFQADVEYYLPRYDLIQVNSDGIFNVKSSISSQNTTVPAPDNDAMAIAVAYVPPFPGVAASESMLYSATKPRIKTTLNGNRVYTMKDVNSLDKRISVLEYYQALSMLEQQAKDYTITDQDGLDRFKNGIFADPLKNHLLGDVSNFEYNVAIDEKLEIARPKIKRNNVDLDVAATSNVKADARIATLDYTKELFISQPYASKFRNVTESVWRWKGSLNLYPEYDHYKNEEAIPAVNVTVDIASPWQQFANSPFGQSYGDWRLVDQSSSSTVIGSENTVNGSNIVNTTTTATTTTSILEQQVQSLNVGTSQTTTDLGSYVTDITLNPYMRSRQVAFIATGLRPSTRVYVFFDGTPVSQYCAPGVLNTSAYNQTTGEIYLAVGKEDQVVTRSAAFGSPINVDANGNVYGVFNIPDSTFRVGDRTMLIVDVDNLETGSDAILTSAQATYTASSLTTTSRDMSITTINPSISATNTVNTIVESSTSVTSRSVVVGQVALPVRSSSSSWGNRNQNRGNSDGSADPLAQSIYITTPTGIPGIFANSIGVYFRSTDPTLGITCYITEMKAGVPDSSRVVATSYLKPSAITTSSDASVETIFNFPDIPYLSSEMGYAFFLRPDGDSPNYTVWMSEIGGKDIQTGNQIFTNPYIGVAFRSANSDSWDPLMTEDVKFNIYRCKFTSPTGTLTLTEQEDEYLTVDGFSYANTTSALQVGDVVYTVNTSGGVITSNTAPFGVVQSYDTVNDTLVLDSSRGGFTSNTNIRIYRPTSIGNTADISNTSLIASAKIVSINNIGYSIVVPQISVTTPIRTNVSFDYKGTSNTNIMDSVATAMQPEADTEFVDQMRYIRSKSNRVANAKTVQMNLKLTSESDFISPIVNLRRRSMIAIENDINNDITNEHTRNGNALTRYLSRVITLAEGQDAEDIKVLITGYRPADTDIHCYIKILSADDPDNFYDKYWTKLNMVEGASVRSSSVNTNDYREFGYGFPTAEALQGTAWCEPSNNGIVQYRNSSGTIFVGYKQFALKFVFTSTAKERVPRLSDIRGICLQI